MEIKKFYLYWADLNPRFGTEPGKLRPVVVIQTDLLNNIHPSTLVCLLTTNIVKQSELLRVFLPKKDSGLRADSDILVDQVRAIDNRRFRKTIKSLPGLLRRKLLDNLHVVIFE